MKIDTRAEDVVYVTIGDWTIYIDNSTGEKIVEQWNESERKGRFEWLSDDKIDSLLSKGVST